MKTSTRFLLAMTVWTASGCEWIAGIEDTTVARDAGPDGGGDDGGGQTDDCPVPACVGDAVGEFATNQDGPWRYVVPYGVLGLLEMRYDLTRNPPGWSAETQNPASIVNCDQHAQAPTCSGLEDRILLQPSVIAGEPRPALSWIARETGTYRLTIDWRLDDTQTSEQPAALLVARNSQLDSVLTAAFSASTEIGTFPQGGSVEIDAVQRDSIALVLAGDTPTGLGVRFYVSELERNDRCQMAFSFQGQNSHPNVCAAAGAELVESGFPTVAAMPLPGIPGVARTFGSDSVLVYEGPVNDYSGDWTLQFWAKLEGAGEVLSDLSCTTDGAGGISVTFDGDTVIFSASDEILRPDCTVPPDEVLLQRDAEFAPEDWHFYRLARNQVGGTVSVCVDGQIVDTLGMPQEATMATDRVLEIGNRADTPEGSFQGLLADLRLYDRALPCLPTPTP
jgi:hypothetical protein